MYLVAFPLDAGSEAGILFYDTCFENSTASFVTNFYTYPFTFSSLNIFSLPWAPAEKWK